MIGDAFDAPLVLPPFHRREPPPPPAPTIVRFYHRQKEPPSPDYEGLVRLLYRAWRREHAANASLRRTLAALRQP